MQTDPHFEPTDGPATKERLRRRIPRYLVSLPERMARAGAALAGGALYETSQVALPQFVRESKL